MISSAYSKQYIAVVVLVASLRLLNILEQAGQLDQLTFGRHSDFELMANDHGHFQA